MLIRGVVFDIGGVLEFTPDLAVSARWESRLGLPSGSLDACLHEVWRGGSLGTLSEPEVHAEIARLMHWSPETVNALMADIWEEYLGTPNTELIEYFTALRPRYQTAILSNSFVGAREREAARYGFPERCDFIVYSHEVTLSKPDPRIYTLTCERLGLEPPEVLFLDDREGAVSEARAIGMRAVLFESNAQAIPELEALLRA